MLLFLDTGYSAPRHSRDTDTGPCLVATPGRDNDTGRGVLLAVAEGLAERPDPDAAACAALNALREGYYTTPEGWRTERALGEAVAHANQLVRATGERDRAAVLSALLLRQRRWWIAHAGDTRVWLLRDHQLKLLTRDHVAPRMGRRPVPNRACGLHATLDAEHLTGELAEGDIFVLATSGVHTMLDAALLMSCLLRDTPAKQMAECISGRAAHAGGQGNLAVCVVRVEKLPAETVADMAENLAALPVITPPAPGNVIDGFHIEALVHKSRPHRVYRALDNESGAIVALRFPNPRHAGDARFADAFLREEWIGKRIECPYLVRTLPLRSGRRSALYSMMAYETGENLADRIKRKRRLSLREAIRHASQLLEALRALHAHGVVHGNVRAKNILVDKKNRRVLLHGLGNTQVELLADMTQSPDRPKRSATHIAPELYAGAPSSARSDIYAAGVVLYQMLTGHYPYGRLSDRDSAPQGPMIPPTRYNDQVPAWLERLLERACAIDPTQRIEAASDFLRALGEYSEAPPTAIFRAHAGSESVPPARRRQSWEWIAVGALLAGLLVYLVRTLP